MGLPVSCIYMLPVHEPSFGATYVRFLKYYFFYLKFGDTVLISYFVEKLFLPQQPFDLQLPTPSPTQPGQGSLSFGTVNLKFQGALTAP